MAICHNTNDFAKKLCEALGLPKHTRSFELRVAVNEAVTCKAEIFVDPNMDDLETVLFEYEIKKK